MQISPYSLSLAALVVLTGTVMAGPMESQTSQEAVQLVASISSNPAKLDEAIKRGKKSGAFCMRCHGDGGYSNQPDTPNLASQNSAYLVEQMNKLADGRRKNAFMEAMIKALTLEERVDIALYFSTQPVPGTTPKDMASAARGKALFQKVCINCHGEKGAGTNKIPRIAGQQAEYLVESITRYRNGSGERIDAQMAAFTRGLKDPDITSLATYISSIP